MGETDSNSFNLVSINKVFHLAMMKSVRRIREFFYCHFIIKGSKKQNTDFDHIHIVKYQEEGC